MITYGVDSPAILGVLEIGVFLSLVMFGVVASQAVIYFKNSGSDRFGLKLLVGSVLFFELCHSVASCDAIYYFTITLAGVPELDKAANSYGISLLAVFETIITALVQGFFVYRIRLLSGRWHISFVSCVLGFLRLLGGMGVAAEGFLDIPLEPDYFHLQDTYGWLITSALFFGAVLDVLITASLCYYIRQLYTPYNLPKSEELIHRLITFTIQTGLITSVMSVAVVIAFQTMKHNFVWLALYTFLAKLYSNSLLVSLNVRPHNRASVRAPSPNSWDTIPSRCASPNSWETIPSRCASPNLTIQITRTVEDDGHLLTGGAQKGRHLQVPEKAVYNPTALNMV